MTYACGKKAEWKFLQVFFLKTRGVGGVGPAYGHVYNSSAMFPL